MVSTGKRTNAGALDDALNSTIRYINNNFYDGYFEDCINLTFNKVNIGEESDKLVVKMNRYSFVRVFILITGLLGGFLLMS